MKGRFVFLFLLSAILVMFHAIADAGNITGGSIKINNNAAYTNSTSVTLTLSCTTTGSGGCTQMEFSNDNINWSAAQTYATTKTWSLTTGDGTKTVYVKFKDNAGNSAWSSAYSDSITLNTTPPSVSITSPSSGTSYTTAQTATVSASASDTAGIAKVEFYDGVTLKGTSTIAPYTYGWTFNAANNGTHSWTAKAYDAAGNVATSTSVSLTVNIASADTTPPTVSISSPASGSAYTTAQTVTITASASDNVGVSKVEFYDGTTLKATDTASPYTYAWAFTSANNGTHSWTAKAYDAAGNVKTSTAVSLTVNIASADTTPPSVSISSPASGSAYTTAQTVTITASASDNVGVSKVEFYDGTTLKATDTASPYTYAWAFTSANNGTHSWTAKAYDAAGNVATSTAVSLTVNIAAADTTPPTVPAGLSATVISSSQINLSWSPSTDTGGSGLSGYKMYRASTQIGTATATTYSDYNLAANTQYCYTVAAYDGAGNTSAQSAQICATTQVSSSGGKAIWAEHVGGNSYDSGNAVAVDSSGNIIVVGYFQGTANFGGGTLTGGSGRTLFIAKYSAAGTYLWAKSFGSTGDVNANAVAVDSAGNIIVGGSLGPTGATVNFGGGTLTSQAPSDIVIAKFSSIGTHLWSKIFNTAGYSAALGVEADSSDNVVITGYFQGLVTFGGTLLNSGGQTNTFIAKFTSAGAHLWSTMVLSYLPNTGYGVAIDSSNNVVVTGSFQGTAYFGGIGGTTLTSVGLGDIFVTKLSSAGSFVWTKAFGTVWDENSYGVAIDSGSNIVITGTYTSAPLDFGGGPLPYNSGTDIFVAKFSPQGSLLWSKGFLASGKSTHVAVDGTGNVVLTGYFMSQVNFGGGLLTSSGSYDAFVAKYAAADGAFLWADRFGGAGIDMGNGVAVDNTGDIVATGFFAQTVDFGGISLTSTGPQDIFLIKLTP